MEISSVRELTQLEVEDSNLFNPWHMNPLDELSILPQADVFGEKLQNSFFNNNYTSTAYELKTCYESSCTAIDRPSKQLKTNSWSSCKTDIADTSNFQAGFPPNSFSFSSSDQLINPMDNLEPKTEGACSKSMQIFSSDILYDSSQNPFGNHSYELKVHHDTKRVSTGKRISETRDHTVAERKRREKLSQKFIALSAMIPGLKKMDKASVLGDTIKYLTYLQEKVTRLEEEARKKSMESVVLVKKTQLFADVNDFSLDNVNFNGPFDEPLPEIEARFCDRSVLIRIHSEKRKGLPEKIMSEIEKSHLIVINSNVMTFGCFALDITAVALMDMQFCMTVKDLVRKLRASFKSLI